MQCENFHRVTAIVQNITMNGEPEPKMLITPVPVEESPDLEQERSVREF